LSAEGVTKELRDYAVVWRTGDGPTASGRLELGRDALVLHGSGGPEMLRIPFDELSSVEVGRATSERINGDKSVVLERHSCERVLIAALAGVGLVGELTDLLARLRAEHEARACVTVIVPIRRGSAEQARRLVEQGPPFDIERLGLERHHVLVSEREVVFFFEGDSAAEAVDALSRSAGVLQAAVRWRGILAGRPRLAEERFAGPALADEQGRTSSRSAARRHITAASARRTSPSEPEPDPGPAARGSCGLAQAEHPHRPLVFDDGKVVKAILGH
jgi:hypothetical protein